ncbi:MAG: hypothetical protein K0S79_64 [Nitrospira sp.]|jgi:hypothetical protein|nr:hypothetical protein [Nitrospira sp.]
MHLDEAIAKSPCGIAVKVDTYQTRTGTPIKALYMVDKDRNGKVRELHGEKTYDFDNYMRGGVAWMPWEEWVNGES